MDMIRLSWRLRGNCLIRVWWRCSGKEVMVCVCVCVLLVWMDGSVERAERDGEHV